jgi:hypothetical protein
LSISSAYQNSTSDFFLWLGWDQQSHGVMVDLSRLRRHQPSFDEFDDERLDRFPVAKARVDEEAVGMVRGRGPGAATARNLLAFLMGVVGSAGLRTS